jgi:hypothetical protein
MAMARPVDMDQRAMGYLAESSGRLGSRALGPRGSRLDLASRLLALRAVAVADLTQIA